MLYFNDFNHDQRTDMTSLYKIKLADVVQPIDEGAFAKAFGFEVRRRIKKSRHGSDILGFAAAHGLGNGSMSRITSGKYLPSDERPVDEPYRVSLYLLNKVCRSLGVTAADIVNEVSKKVTIKNTYTDARAKELMITPRKPLSKQSIERNTKRGIDSFLINKQLARAISDCLYERDMNRTQLSRLSGISGSTINTILSDNDGVRTDAAVSTYAAIAMALEIELHELFKMASKR